jgi:hypothetical protein
MLKSLNIFHRRFIQITPQEEASEAVVARSDPDLDRPFGIAFALLGAFDDGDTESTLLRLWRRTVKLLQLSATRTAQSNGPCVD